MSLVQGSLITHFLPTWQNELPIGDNIFPFFASKTTQKVIIESQIVQPPEQEVQ